MVVHDAAATTGRMSSTTVTGDHPDRDRRVADLATLIDVVAPIVEDDGGTLTVDAVDVETGVVSVTLAGACGSCAVSGATLEAGIERILRQRLDWVTGIVGNVDTTDTGVTGVGGWTPKR